MAEIKGKLTVISVAIEHNADGSVTFCRELVEELLVDPNTSERIKGYLTRKGISSWPTIK